MKRTLAAVGASLVALTTAPAAMAQQAKGDFGQQGQFIISADRLFQLFAFDNWSRDDFNNQGFNVKSATVTDSQTFTSFFYGRSPNAGIDPFFTVPRLGFDYTIVPNVTIGGNLIAVFSLGGSHKTEVDFNSGTTQTTSTDNPSFVGFGIEPRGGYILQLTDLFSLWLRGGFSYYIASSKTNIGNNVTQTETLNQFALDLEPQFVLTPLNHVAFTAGIDADIPLTGGISVDTNNGGTTTSVSGHSGIFYIGLDLGMAVYF